MKILVTGANGFIGSNLVRHLALKAKYKVCALVRKGSKSDSLAGLSGRIEIVRITPSFRSLDHAIALSRPDVVVHLAALSVTEHKHSQVRPLISSNILFPAQLIEAMVKNDVRCLVNTGSFWEYMSGGREYRPANLYAATKYALEQVMRYYEDAEGLRSVTLKLYGIYGPRDPRKKIFYFLKKSVYGKEPVAFSPGRQMLDLVYIDDVVDAFERSINYIYKKGAGTSETFLIGSGNGERVRDIARIYEECAGRRSSIEWGGLPYRRREIMAGIADIRQAKKKLGWEPRVGLREGITKMLHAEKRIKI